MAYAALDVTFNFNRQPVTAYAYDCLDSTCGSVGTFSGSFQTSNPTSNGAITIRFPDSPATPYKYALYFVSPGYRPMVYRPNAHSNGDPAVYTHSEQIDFSKVSTCRAQVSKFSVVNNIKPNIPVVVDISASLDANTGSAFRMIDQNVAYVPDEIKQDYMSADTDVKLQIYKDGTMIDEQKQSLAIYADQSTRAEFTYIPRSDGTTTSVVE